MWTIAKGEVWYAISIEVSNITRSGCEFAHGVFVACTVEGIDTFKRKIHRRFDVSLDQCHASLQ